MKKYLFIVSLICFFSFISNINATSCDKAKKESDKVQSYYKIVNEEEVHFNIIVENITPNIYLNVTSSHSNTTEKYDYSNTEDGILAFKYMYKDNYYTLKIDIHSNTDDCKDTLLKTVTLTTPKYNTFYDTKTCKIYSNFKYCVPFIGIKTKKNDNTQNGIESNISNKKYEITENDFNESLNDYILEKEKMESNILYKSWAYIKEYYLYATVPLIIVFSIYLTAILKIKGKVK